jgi:hypothetical protein
VVLARLNHTHHIGGTGFRSRDFLSTDWESFQWN